MIFLKNPRQSGNKSRSTGNEWLGSPASVSCQTNSRVSFVTCQPPSSMKTSHAALSPIRSNPAIVFGFLLVLALPMGLGAQEGLSLFDIKNEKAETILLVPGRLVETTDRNTGRTHWIVVGENSSGNIPSIVSGETLENLSAKPGRFELYLARGFFGIHEGEERVKIGEFDLGKEFLRVVVTDAGVQLGAEKKEAVAPPAPAKRLRVFCEAGYVGLFEATWKVNGQPKSWSSGNLPLGQRREVQIPGNATDVVLRGFMISAGKHAVFEKRNPDFSQEYKLFGTIFGADWGPK